jgi:hypothetical protein
LLGGRYREASTAITVDEQGNAAVVGYTSSMDFPMRYPFQAPFNKSTGFLAKFNADGSDLLYSTYLGDSHPFSAIALARDPSGALILAGSTAESDGKIFVNRIIEAGTPPTIHLDSVLNTASLFGGPIAPGEWITLRGGGFGPESRVMLGDAPILIASATSTEILARVPDTFQPNGATTMRIDSSDLSSQSIFVNSASSAAAIFTQDATGIGQALAFNADGSLNGPSNPAARGTKISITANGLGVLSPDRSIGLFFSCGGAIPGDVQSGPIAGLPGDRNSLVNAIIPAAICPPSGSAGIALVVDGVITFTPPVTISVQ